jgi:hypothetical protein
MSCFALLLHAALAATTATLDLGPTNQGVGLTVPSAGDGVNEPVTVAGRAARRVVGERGAYLYVCVDGKLFAPGDHTLYLTVELLDDGLRAVGVQFDSVAATPTIVTKYQHGPSLVFFGQGGWRRRTVRLEHARLGHGQNHGADLRLVGACTVARLELSDTAPPGFDPDRPLPDAELAAVRTRIGPGVELTVGNDTDTTQAMLLRSLGVTSVESYVTWQTVEDAGRGQWDWSRWDKQVAVLERAGLKWVPFLIAGPAYANPKWFREGAAHAPYVCLEHGQPSKVESLWNPALKPEIERFLQAVADRYAARGVIESVLLGITGIYGESIYPAGPSDGWTMGIPGVYHNHGGWWAGDPLAQAAFRAAVQRRYGTLAALNAAWGTAYASFDEVRAFLPAKAPGAAARADFVRWYEDEMTAWSRWWAAAARRAFPAQRLYLCTGGDGAPYLGADFTAQTKAVAPYGVGIRITNEASDYAANFAVTREVATATRLYKTYCGFEPAGDVNERGVVVRVYNATASGAAQLHYYTPNLFGSPAATTNFRRVAPLLQSRRPAPPPVAVYLPRAAWAQDAGRVGQALALVRQWRARTDLDLVNATSVADGVLATCRLLLLPTESDLEPAARAVIDRWVEDGGLLVVAGGPAAAGVVAPRAERVPPDHLRVAFGVDGDDAFLGGDWNGPEEGREFPTPGARKRWSSAGSEVWLPLAPGRPVRLEIEAITPPAALRGVSGAILLDGTPLGGLRPGHATYRYNLLPSQVRQGLARLSFEVRGWRPSEVEGTGDTRLLGIALTRVDLVRDEQAPRATNSGLTVGIALDKLPVTRVGRGARLLLPSVPAPARDALVAAVVGPLATRLGAPGLLDPDTGGGMFATRLARGRLLLNATDQPRTCGGVTIEPWGIAEAP